MDKILPRFTRRGAFAERLHGSRAQRRGLPDILYVYRGVVGLVEAKMPGKKLRPDQAQVALEISRAGGTVPVVESVEAALGLLDQIDRLCDEAGL